MTVFPQSVARVGALLAAAVLGVVVFPLASQAEPGGQPVTRCSSWVQVGLFRDKACVTMDPSSASIRHDHYIEYLGAGTAGAYAASYYYINSGIGTCVFNAHATYSSGQTHSYTCYTARHTGYVYHTEGYFDDGAIDSWKGRAVSPTVTG
jgi:hypothetical protein